LSGVAKESLLSAYDLAREVSPQADARLLIEEMPVVVHCHRCQSDQLIASIQEMRCPECGTVAGDVISGRELEVVSLEIEDDDAEDNAAG